MEMMFTKLLVVYHGVGVLQGRSARLSREGPPTLMILFVISILPIPFRYSFWLLVFTCLYLKKK